MSRNKKKQKKVSMTKRVDLIYILSLGWIRSYLIDWLTTRPAFDESSLKWTINSAPWGVTPFNNALGEWGKRFSLLLARCYVTHYMGSSLLKWSLSFQLADVFLCEEVRAVQILRIGDFVENQIQNIKNEESRRNTKPFSNVKSCDLHANFEPLAGSVAPFIGHCALECRA